MRTEKRKQTKNHICTIYSCVPAPGTAGRNGRVRQHNGSYLTCVQGHDSHKAFPLVEHSARHLHPRRAETPHTITITIPIATAIITAIIKNATETRTRGKEGHANEWKRERCQALGVQSYQRS